MSKVALTGANGFLGWHTRIALFEQGLDVAHVPVGNSFDSNVARDAISGASRAIHIAGVNRANNESDIYEGNILFAKQFATGIIQSENPPKSVIFANSTQANSSSVYGESKKKAADILAEAASTLGIEFIDIYLPNLFGEHGKPFYNSVTSTFSHLLAQGEKPQVVDDKELTLLHAQNAADILIGAKNVAQQIDLEHRKTVSELLTTLTSISKVYELGEIPEISHDFDRDLFNTYRSFTFEKQTPLELTRHSDDRGSFFEIIRSHGGPGQSSFSTTNPGISRGDHFHRRKVERFTVLSGQATISLRKMFTDRVYEFDVTGEAPVAVDMPTGWTHKIVNTGEETLYTSFWTNDIFNPTNPDTIMEAV